MEILTKYLESPCTSQATSSVGESSNATRCLPAGRCGSAGPPKSRGSPGYISRLTYPEVVRAVARLTRTVLVPSDLISSDSSRLHKELRRSLRERMTPDRG